MLGNFLVPMMIGARDLAFPRLNLASWYIYMTGGSIGFMGDSLAGARTRGWTFYTPYSTSSSHSNVLPMAFGILVVGFSSILTGLNFIVTIHKMRAPGLTWFRLPLFIWSIYATSIIFLLGTPVLAAVLALLAIERITGIGIFDPALGGDPLLFQHLFWFYSHPAVYIMILPGMGVVSEVIPCFSRKNIFGYHFVAFSSVSIAVLGFLVWGHHMFVAGQSAYVALAFSVMSYLVAVPSAIKVFNWTATLYKGSISYHTPMLFSLGFIGLFTMGGLTGLFLAALGIDIHVHDTYFIIAHFHFIMVGGMVMAYMSGLHFWWPKITGRLYPEGWGRLAALIVFIGFILTFLPQFVLGYMGMPRRYHHYLPKFQVLNVMSSAGASILAVGYITATGVFDLVVAVRKTRRAKSVGGHGTRMANTFAAADGKLRSHACRDTGPMNIRSGRTIVSTSDSALATHFDTLEQQHEAGSYGMWIFLASELMIFGALFAGYSAYRAEYPQAFAAASRATQLVDCRRSIPWFLLSSSLTMVLAVHAVQTGRQRKLSVYLIFTILLGAIFMLFKGLEYYLDYRENLVPGLAFHRDDWSRPRRAAGARAAVLAVLLPDDRLARPALDRGNRRVDRA